MVRKPISGKGVHGSQEFIDISNLLYLLLLSMITAVGMLQYLLPEADMNILLIYFTIKHNLYPLNKLENCI